MHAKLHCIYNQTKKIICKVLCMKKEMFRVLLWFWLWTLWKRWVMYWYVMVTHFVSTWGVNIELLPTSLWPRFHHISFLTVQQVKVRIKTNLNLTQSLVISILSITKEKTIKIHLNIFLKKHQTMKYHIHFLKEIMCLYLCQKGTLYLGFDAIEILDHFFNLWKLQRKPDWKDCNQ